MKILDLPVETREKLGSANSRRYCRAGQIPSVLYGGKRDSVSLVFQAEDFDSILKAHTALVRLRLSDEVNQTALVRNVTWDTFGNHIQHVDLQRVAMEDEIQLAVPIHILGVPAGVAHGGVLHFAHREVQVHSRVDSIPSEIEIDVSQLDLGDRVTVGELDYPEHVRAALPADEPVVFVKEPKVAVVEEEAVEAPEPGAEGDEPAEPEKE